MKMNKIFVACDTVKISKVNEIIKKTQNNKIKVGYKFGLEFLNSKYGRNFLLKLRNKITFIDLKLHDIPNTCISTIKAIKDLRPNLGQINDLWPILSLLLLVSHYFQ